jgi:hypothetical protein
VQNVKPPAFVTVAQELFGGLYTEATPESLPQGASPLCVNCDFEIGTVFMRPGKQNVYYFADFFEIHDPAHAESDPGLFAPDEVPWNDPENVTTETPYASVEVNHAGGGGGVSTRVDFSSASLVVGSTTATGGTTTPLFTDLVIYFQINQGIHGNGCTATGLDPAISNVMPGLSGLNPVGVVNCGQWGLLPPGTVMSPVVATSITTNPNYNICGAAIVALPTNGSTPAITAISSVSGAIAGPVVTGAPNRVVPANCTLLAIVNCAGNNQITSGEVGAMSDNHGNTWELITGNTVQSFYAPDLTRFGATIHVFICTSDPTPASDYQFSVQITSSFQSGVFEVFSITNLATFPSLPNSEILLTNNYNFNIPATQGVLGFQVLVTGHQTSSDPSAIISVFLNEADNPTLDSPTYTGQLPASDGTIVFGTPTSNWGLELTNDVLNDPNFGISILPTVDAGIDTSWFISAVQLKVYLTPDPAPNVNYIKTFTETGGEILTLVLFSSGSMMQEDVLNNEGVLTEVYSAIEPDTFAQSATIDDREFIALSNLRNGTDIPLTYTPPNFDRLSQVGPGAPPTVTTTHTSAGITISTITQEAATEIRRIAWGASSNAMNNSTAGNVLVVFGEGRTGTGTHQFDTLPNVHSPNSKVWLSGIQVPFPKKSSGSFPYDLNSVTAGVYDIQSVGTGIVGGLETCPLFTLTAPAIEYGYSEDFGEFGGPTSNWFYQSTLATITTATQIPNLAVGGTIEITGTGGAPPAGYDGTWTTLSSPNASVLEITGSSMVNGNLTFDYIAVAPNPPPAVGQLITITGTNGGNGTYNVANLQITAQTASTFTVVLSGPGIPLNAGPDIESGSGQIFGTIFTFEPAELVGNKTGGTVVQQGLITAGQRKCCYSFLTRNGFMTQPSPIATFFITDGAGALVVSDLLTGPSNVIARVIHFTATNGSNFYNIPEPVTIIDNDIPVINDSTWVNDNTATSATLSFSDGVLLAGEQIDIEGNNLFECIELGSCVMLVPYSNRVFAVGEQNKVPNFINWSFDGGIVGGYPAGWTPDSEFKDGGSVVDSPIFGKAYQIENSSGITKAAYGMIEQNAFQDEFKVAIINPSTTYSVRITCACTTGAASGDLRVDLINRANGVVLGEFVLPLASITTSMTIYTGTLLTTTQAPVPELLKLRLWTSDIPDGVTVLMDRVEPFPTEAPNLNQQVTGSYENNFEAFDKLSGVILGTNINQQPIVSAFILSNDALYLVKTGSIVAVADNDTTEPSNWTRPRSISASVGASGPYAVTTGIDEPNSGEDWAILAGRSGGFIFNGGQPIKLTEEIQAVWNQINWAAGYCIWVKNDITNRRILFGVPLNEKNARGESPLWLPAGLLSNPVNPTTPNAIIELNYEQISTANELSGSPEVHGTYAGKLIASEIVRKWSIWIVKSPCAAFVERANGTAPIFIGNSDQTGKVYDLINGLLEDDGLAIDQLYDTSAFVDTQQGQGSQMGVARMNYDYMTMLIDGSGVVVISVLPNTLDGPFSHVLLPNLTLPASNNGDVELPVNECASRLFVQFESNAVGAEFRLSRLVMAMHADPWSPVRGRNN